MAKAETTSSWPDGLRWPVTSAWQAEKLAKVVFGIETRGVEEGKASGRLAKRLFDRNLSYSPTTIPSSLRPDNFITQATNAIRAGHEPLRLSAEDSKTAYERLLVMVGTNVDQINGEPPVIEEAEANFLLDRIKPIVDDALYGEVEIDLLEEHSAAAV